MKQLRDVKILLRNAKILLGNATVIDIKIRRGVLDTTLCDKVCQ